MRVLVVGSGGREHALAWRLSRDPGVERVLVAPGNAGMHDVADVHPAVSQDRPDDVRALCERAGVELVVVGPEGPLVAGLADTLRAAGVAVFGPSARAAAIEGSKAFCREIAGRADIPMADGAVFDEAADAARFARRLGAPVVVKADGLAAGKGVVVCGSLPEAEAAIDEMLVRGAFGAAGRRIVVERALRGREASVIAICDATTALALPAARDHKRIGEGDTGPNTGGMGAYSPLHDLDDVALTAIVRRVHAPALAALGDAGQPFRGALFAGVMLTAEGPVLLEFNARLGDPETQALLPRLASDVPLGALLEAAARDTLARTALALGLGGALLPSEPEARVAVVLAAAGYPGAPRRGDAIDGIERARADGALVFAAGVEAGPNGLRTAGGRVLTIVGRGASVEDAAAHAYGAADRVRFEGRLLRRDIGRPAAVAAA